MKKEENIEISKSYIATALFELMEENDYEAISISDIAKKAGVSRATFYRHFDTKDQIVRDYFISETNTFLKNVKGDLLHSDDLYEMLFTSFSQLKQQKKIFQRLMDAHMEEVYLNYLNEMLRMNFASEKKFRYLSECLSGSLYNMSLEWVKNDCRESVKYMTDGYFKILKNLFS